MKVVVVTGSPHRKGTSALLADQFIAGATHAGHEVFRFDAAFETVGACRGCGACGMGAKPCVQADGMTTLNPHLLEADVVAFVTPLYYYNMSAQLKAVIDRFYANNTALMGGKKAVLLATAWNDDDWTMRSLATSYETITRYLKWGDAGQVLATGCGERGAIEHSAFPEQAFALGGSLN